MELRARFHAPVPHPAPSATPSRLVHGDGVRCLQALASSASRPALIYVDPPFLTGRTFHARRSLRTPAGEPVEQTLLAYDDTWEAGLDGYLAWLETLLEAAHAALAPEGSLLLHLDHRVAPYAALACDRIFGRGDRQGTGRRPGFRNELIWTYGLGGSSARSWPRKHDTLLWYTRGTDWFFEPPRVPARSIRMRGQTKKMPDVLDIPAINNMAAERCGYPTQKPLALLTLLLRAHAPPGTLVVDPCCGSGTTLVAAVETGHQGLGADPGWEAFRATRDRVLAAGSALELLEGPGRRRPAALPLTLESTRGRTLLRSPSLLSAAWSGQWRDGCYHATRSLLPQGEGSHTLDVPPDAASLWVESHEGRFRLVPTAAPPAA